jgi:uncharacterized RDD family membrane protein YckC
MKYAGFWRRLIAISIDEFLVGLAGYALASAVVVVALYVSPVTQAKYDSVYNYSVIFANILVGLLYFVLMEGKAGETVGKKLMKLKLVRIDQPNRDGIGIDRAAFRLIAASFLQLFAGVNYVVMLLSPERRTLQDALFKTAVVFDPAGKFPAFDPEKLPAAPRRRTLFVVALIISFLSAVGQIIYVAGLI